jgi:hypothetical protein
MGSRLKSNNPLVPGDRVSADTRFVLIRGRVTNLGKQEVVTPGALHVIDQQGREYSPDPVDGLFIPDSNRALGLATLRPSIPFEFEVIFAVAGDSRPVMLKVGELGELFGAAEKLISLQ